MTRIMKTTILTFFSLLLSLTVIAGFLPEDSSCARIAGFDMERLEISVQSDLMDGIWTSPGEARVIEFEDNGIAEIIVEDENGHIGMRNAFWSTSVHGGLAYLYLDQGNASPDMYQLSLTCQGITLQNLITGKRSDLLHQPKQNSTTRGLLERKIVGSWASISYPFTIAEGIHGCGVMDTMPHAYIKWRFEEDGLFRMQVGSDFATSTEEGIWELSANGNYLILRFAENGDPNRIYKTAVLEVPELSFEDLSLKNTLVPDDFKDILCADGSLVHFAKA